jgi:hypothetical protein
MKRKMRGEAGSMVIEALLAAALLTAFIGLNANTILTSQKIQSKSQARVVLASAAQNELAKSRVAGCGLERGDEPNIASLTNANRCGTTLGSYTYTTTVGRYPVSVTMSTAWDDTVAGIAPPQSATTGPGTLSDGQAANVLRRTVTASTTERGQAITETVADSVPVPPNAYQYNNSTRGAIVLLGADPARWYSTGGATPIWRQANSNGELLFPFLPAGAYQPNSVGSLDGSPTSISGGAMSVSAGSVTCRNVTTGQAC